MFVYPVEAVEGEHFGESSRKPFSQSFILKIYQTIQQKYIKEEITPLSLFSSV